MYEQSTFRKLLLTLFGLILLGTSGFLMLGEESLWKAFYRTVIILLSHFDHGSEGTFGLQILNIFLIIGSFFIVAYIIKFSADFFLGGEFKEKRRKHKMLKDISKMKDHYVICGFGRVGKQVAEDLAHAKVDFVILDRDQREISQAQALGFNALAGDPTKESHLLSGGIMHARAVITCLGEDTDNLFATLTARSINPDVYIVARANDDENIEKFEKAGANRVAIPYQIGGYHMATMALRPAVLDFIDVIVDSRHQELEVEEIEVGKNSPLLGKTIGEELSRDKTGTTVLAINHGDGTSKVNPNGHEVIHYGDKIIIMGNRTQLDMLTQTVA